MFSPTKSAFLKAVKNGHLITWTYLTKQAINKPFKLAPSNTMSHMQQRRQHIRSTSKNSTTSDMGDEAVAPIGLGTKTHLIYAVVVDQGQLYKNINGKIMVRSSKGDWYVMVCYSYE
jgi:hypothetical protein